MGKGSAIGLAARDKGSKLLQRMRKVVAQVVAADSAGIAAAAERLKSGGNVAFPTETVYGLGGNALDENAVRSIFQVKGRPLTDPLIVHVLDAESALQYVRAEGVTKKIFDLLAKQFWPGPLTMVLRATERVPTMVGAETGFIGVRAPAHPIARQLLQESGVPVAAPSANRFGHVSPTSCQHVLDDLGDQNIAVVDGGDLLAGSCLVGIESTVLKIVDSSIDCNSEGHGRRLVLFRRGGVPETEIRKALDQAGFDKVEIVSPKGSKDASAKSGQNAQETAASGADGETVAQQAPGQLITHYAPDIDTWLVPKQSKAVELDASSDGSDLRVSFSSSPAVDPLVLEKCALIDFQGTLSALRSHVLAYRDLSTEGNVEEAAQGLFDALRWTETTRAQHVLIQDVSFQQDSALAPSVADRMFRAASGKVALDFSII